MGLSCNNGLAAAFKDFVGVIMFSAGAQRSNWAIEPLSHMPCLSYKQAVYRWLRIPLLLFASDSPWWQNDSTLLFLHPSTVALRCYKRILRWLDQIIWSSNFVPSGCLVASWSCDAMFMPLWQMCVSPLSSSQHILHCQRNETVSHQWQSDAVVSRGHIIHKAAELRQLVGKNIKKTNICIQFHRFNSSHLFEMQFWPNKLLL